jgi:hypothetical protein
MEPEDQQQAQAPSPFAAQSVYPPDTGATNPELAKQFLEEHRQQMAARTPEIDNALSKMQLNTDTMTKMLDDTTAAIKSARDNRISTPLLAIASGLLGSRGNFGQALGEGLGLGVKAIQQNRTDEDNMNMQLAQIALRRAGLENMPLQQKLAYMKAMQTGDQGAMRGIEQALIRAQAKTGNQDQQLQKTRAAAIDKALTEARKQVDSMGKEMFATADEREAEIRRRFEENIKITKAGGVDIPDSVLDPIRQQIASGAPGSRTGMTQRASYFDSPNTPEREQKTLAAGLPPAPAGYVYDAIGPKDRPKMLMEQTQNFQKESKDWDSTSATQRTLLDKIDQAEKILDKHPKIVGPSFGAVPNKFIPNLSEHAQTLTGLFNGMQLNDVPKGQGAVSNMERELFASASPNMGINADANKNLMNIQKEIIKRDRDRRDFFTEYFNNYKTTDGMTAAWDRYINSAGSAFKRDENGAPVPNNNRMPWREFFKAERGAQGHARGGAIKLGPEHD